VAFGIVFFSFAIILGSGARIARSGVTVSFVCWLTNDSFKHLSRIWTASRVGTVSGRIASGVPLLFIPNNCVCKLERKSAMPLQSFLRLDWIVGPVNPIGSGIYQFAGASTIISWGRVQRCNVMLVTFHRVKDLVQTTELAATEEDACSDGPRMLQLCGG
jgi:hypothetical protein